MIPGDPVKVFDLHRRTRLYCWQPATFLQHLRSGRVAVRVVTDGVARRVVTDAANVKAAPSVRTPYLTPAAATGCTHGRTSFSAARSRLCLVSPGAVTTSVEIEAVQFSGEGGLHGADNIFDAFPDIRATHYMSARPPYLVVDTLEGRMIARAGDWIIRGVQGEFYPCKPDIFEATYEFVEAQS